MEEGLSVDSSFFDNCNLQVCPFRQHVGAISAPSSFPSTTISLSNGSPLHPKHVKSASVPLTVTVMVPVQASVTSFVTIMPKKLSKHCSMTVSVHSNHFDTLCQLPSLIDSDRYP